MEDLSVQDGISENKKEISCQLALYPLGDQNYSDIISRVIESLEGIEGLYVEIGSMSTVIFGEEKLVWDGIKKLYREADKKCQFSLIATFSNVCGPFCEI
jgi:uncharacterized protein YqgV (UPF0045/DUF77 family)